MAAVPPGPVQVSLQAPSLVRAGVQALLATRSERVVLLPPRSERVPDIDVFDPVDHASAARTARAADVPLVALLHHPDLVAMAMALELGAVRVLTLAASADELVSTFEDVRSGAHEEHRQTGPRHDADGLLSVREAEIVAGICRGLSNAEIAGELYLSINSVKTYIRSAYRKMGVTRRSQAVVWGIEHGYRTC